MNEPGRFLEALWSVYGYGEQWIQRYSSAPPVFLIEIINDETGQYEPLGIYIPGLDDLGLLLPEG